MLELKQSIPNYASLYLTECPKTLLYHYFSNYVIISHTTTINNNYVNFLNNDLIMQSKYAATTGTRQVRHPPAGAHPVPTHSGIIIYTT